MTATEETTISARLAQALLESLDAAGNLSVIDDLCLVRIVPNLDDAPLPPEIMISGQRRWKLAMVDGDLALRVALVDADSVPLVALTTRDESSFQADLRERAVLRRTIRPQARHIFSALVGIDATALDDDRFGPAIRDVLAGNRRDALTAAIRKRTWGHTVRESDAIAVLCMAAFGFDDRFTEDEPGALWAAWIAHPPLQSDALTALAVEVLRTRYPVYATLLAGLETRDLAVAFRDVAGHTFAGDPLLSRLAFDTGTRLRASHFNRLRELLAPAEQAYIAAGSPDVASPLLASAMHAKARALTLACRTEHPPTTEDVESLARYLFDDASTRETLLRLARLARGLQALASSPIPATLRALGDVYRDQLAWLDRVARRARECVMADSEAARTRDDLVEHWYDMRDRWNAAFGQTLAANWSDVFRFPGTTHPYVVSHVLKHIVRPGLATRKTFLVVLDGCDMPTFFDFLDAVGGAGYAPADVQVALSAIPTVTSHARRAIFGGDIPGDSIGDDDRAADASGDRIAFEGTNAYLGPVTRKLFLKGDLGDGGRALVDVLADPERAPALVAVVFNDVDDAIASKEHHVLAERTLERWTQAFRNAFFAAFDAGWRIVVTADHGHTPYRQPDVKAATAHPRFSILAPNASAPPGTIVFEPGIGMPPYRIAALHQMGSHAGPQHLGYHGGVALEEMFVPLAIFDKSAIAQTLLPPAWWDDLVTATTSAAETSRVTSRIEDGSLTPVPAMATIQVTPPVAPPSLLADASPTVPIRATQRGVDSQLRVRARAALAERPQLVRILDAIAEAESLSAAQLASRSGIPIGRLRQFVIGLVDHLRAAGIESPIVLEDEPLVFRWIGPR